MQNDKTMGKLYIVPTPVGNLEDMTFRAINILKQVDVILAEDTRTSGILMQHFDIHTPLRSHHKFNEHQQVATIVLQLQGGMTMALVSDAGTPGISDPGFLLSRECAQAGVEVETLPGPTAFVPALVDSGLPCDRFRFEGFLPQKKGRLTRIEALRNEELTTVFYESPYRIVRLLEQIVEVLGSERQVSITREISKVHEQTVHGTAAEVLEHFRQNEPKGEFVVIVGGAEKNCKTKENDL